LIPLPAKPVVLLAGPTASGKSALALHWAETAGAEIVNADSQQLYADLRVLSARPSPEEEARAPHHLYGVADGAEAWSVGRWLRAVLPVLAEIRARGRTALVVGGTGLYFRALTQGLAEVPPVPDEVVRRSEQTYDDLGEAGFRAALAGRDTEAADRISPGDRQRLVRAWAVAEATGRALSDWRNSTTTAPLSPEDWTGLVVEPPRADLYRRCDLRVRTMVQAGALDEAARLQARGLPPELPVMRALGVRPFAAHAAGSLDLAAAVAEVQGDTRRYAKRQLTWFRNQTPDWPRLFSPESATIAH
jgi:tRNA dimethylallyltransferase